MPVVTSCERGFRSAMARTLPRRRRRASGAILRGWWRSWRCVVGRGLGGADLGRRPRPAAGQRRRLVVGMAGRPGRGRARSARWPAGATAGPSRGCWPLVLAGPDGRGLRGPRPHATTASRPTGRSAGRSWWCSASSAPRASVYRRDGGSRLTAARPDPALTDAAAGQHQHRARHQRQDRDQASTTALASVPVRRERLAVSHVDGGRGGADRPGGRPCVGSADSSTRAVVGAGGDVAEGVPRHRAHGRVDRRVHHPA